MLEMRPDCEKCGTQLTADQHGAYICSFECSFCTDCAEGANRICPNCGGDLVRRPTRSRNLLEKFPASTERKFEG